MTLSAPPNRSFSLGVALSGGTLRAAAHIGVLEVLETHGIHADIVAGTSGGSLISTLYARGLSPSFLTGMAGVFPGARLIDWSVPLRQAFRILLLLPLHYLHIIENPVNFIPFGLIKGKKFEQYVRTALAISPIRTPIPFLIATTDLLQNKTVVFHSRLQHTRFQHIRLTEEFNQAVDWLSMENDVDPKALSTVIRASCAIPGIFEPVSLAGRTLVDGSIRNYLPVDLLYLLGVKKVIAVDLHKTEIDNPIDTFPEVVTRSMDIMLDQITLFRKSRYNPFVITPKIRNVKWTSFDKVLACIDAGREAALKALPEIREYLRE